MTQSNKQQQHLLEQLSAIAEGLSRTFKPFCEVVVHDLTEPNSGIYTIYNPLSNRQSKDALTALGQARQADAKYPQIVANYPNKLSDGRQLKSTSVGIKDEAGNYVAAFCMNVDTSVFTTAQQMLSQLTAFEQHEQKETLYMLTLEDLQQYIQKFAVKQATTIQALKAPQKKQLLQELKKHGFLDIRLSIDTIAQTLGVSRTSVYGYLK